MPHPTPYAERLADEITHRLARLADHLSQLPPPQATQVIAHVLEPDEGVLAGVGLLMATGSVFAKDQAGRGALPPEVWLALGRASNAFGNIALDLEPHLDTLRHLGTRPASAGAKPPAPAPLVVRRRR